MPEPVKNEKIDENDFSREPTKVSKKTLVFSDSAGDVAPSREASNVSRIEVKPDEDKKDD